MTTSSNNNSERTNPQLSAANHTDPIHNPTSEPTEISNNNAAAFEPLLQADAFSAYDRIEAYPVSMGRRVRSKEQMQKTSLAEIVRHIQTDPSLKRIVDKVRSVSNPDEDKAREERQELKATLLPYFIFSSFKDGIRLNETFLETEFLLFDADHVADPQALRAKLKLDPAIFMIFTSPSGDGLKFVCRLEKKITAELSYKATYRELMEKLEKQYSIPLDHTVDQARATFLSYDPEIYVNPDAHPVPVSEYQEPVQRKKQKGSVSRKKLIETLKMAAVGDRTSHMSTLIGTMNRIGVPEAEAVMLLRAWNQANQEPHEDSKVTGMVSDMYARYSNQAPLGANAITECNNSYFKQSHVAHGIQERQLTNFVIRPLELLELKTGDCLTARIETASERCYENILIENSDWHSKQKLLKAIAHSDCSFLGTDTDVQALCMHVIEQVEVRKKGTSVVGLHEDRWVAEKCNITESGWNREEEVVPYAKGADSFTKKIAYARLDDAEYSGMLKELYNMLPEINDPSVIYPWLSWVLASPMKMRFQAITGGFPLVFVHGGQGSGKTSTAELFMRLSGYREAKPFSCTMKTFPMLKLLCATNGVPVILDEFKKSDMKEEHYEGLLRYMRKLYTGEVEAKGNADQTTTDYELSAPVAVMGEWSINQSAILERLIKVSFTGAAKKERRMQQAFARVSSLPLEGFMPKYIEFCLQEDLEFRFKCAERLVGLVFKTLVIAPRVKKNLALMVAGLGLWKTFGRKNGLRVAKIGFRALLQGQLKEITGTNTGSVQSAVDQLIEGIAEMARGTNFFIKNDYKVSGSELWIHFSKIFPEFKRYAQLTHYEGDLLEGRSYSKLFDETEYIIEKNKTVRLGEKKIVRCLIIDIPKAKHAGVDLEGFGL